MPYPPPRVGESKPYPHRVTFEAKTDVQDEYGSVHPSWDLAFKTWADFEPLGGREFSVNARQAADATARFRIRFRPALLEDHAVENYRLQYIHKTWNVHAIYQRDGLNNELYIEASEVD